MGLISKQFADNVERSMDKASGCVVGRDNPSDGKKAVLHAQSIVSRIGELKLFIEDRLFPVLSDGLEDGPCCSEPKEHLPPLFSDLRLAHDGIEEHLREIEKIIRRVRV